MNETFNFMQRGQAMINIGKDTRLTDELERQLMMRAIEEQYRFKPGAALKKLFAKLSAATQGAKPQPQAAAPVHSAG
ncbi:hypothetical protein [Pollutimonas sp. M17]|uniref:hypothetical protein n=1 Tax=Pollutimonas sp. M17 TaxID=2962065 RepID=UPI0021F4B83E|nr:hypothetical protein [Pollutimonas sp. M17]UYO94844.1 hypothetical protein OEG81_05895 [Pollutimonas sp. M17]